MWGTVGTSVGRRRVEPFDQPLEGSLKCRLVLIGMSADEVDDLSVVAGGLFVVAAGLVDHIDDGVGCAGEFIGVIVTKRVAAEIAMSMIVVVMMVVGGGGESFGGGLEEDSALGTLILLEAAALVFLSATAVARIVASDLDLESHGSWDFIKTEPVGGTSDTETAGR